MAEHGRMQQGLDLLLEGIEQLEVGLTVFDGQLSLVAANGAFQRMLGFPDALCRPGVTLGEALLFNARQGEYGPGEPEQLMRPRLALARQFLPHRFERLRPDGSIIEVVGRPLTGGGMVTTYTDVTAARKREAALKTLAEELEQRVVARTAQLAQREAELAQKATLLQAVVDNVDQGISYTNAQLNLEICNQKFVDLLQLPPDFSQPGKSFEEMARFNAQRGEYGSGDVDALVASRVDVARQFLPHRLERTRPDGTVLEVIGTPTQGGGMVTTYQDITARKQAERALLQSQQQTDMALAGANMGLWDWDLTNGKFLHKNQRIVLGGYTAEEIKRDARFFLAHTHPDDLPEFKARLRQHLKYGGDVFEYEYRVRHKDGSWMWAVIRGNAIERDAAGRATRMIGTYLDVTQRKLIELALRSEREQLSNIIAGTNAGTWEANLVTQELKLNDRYAEILGRQVSDLKGGLYRLTQEFCHPEDLPGVNATFLKMLKGEVPFYYTEFRLWHAQKRWVWVASCGRCSARDEFGRALFVSGIQMDINARKLAEAQIRDLNETLEQRVQQRSQELNSAMSRLHQSHDELARSKAKATLSTLVASVSHELATPLGNSLMTASTLVDQARRFRARADAGQLRRAELTTFLDAVTQGNDLVTRNLHRAGDLVKNFKQVAADQASEQRRHFDLGTTLAEVVEILGPSLKQLSHRVALDVQADIQMQSYPGPLGQVVINLINNCYLHAFDGISGGCVTVRGSANSDRVSICVSDNGTGMTPEHLSQLFRPFFSTKIGQGGTGLGMTIVQNLVHKTLGGSIKVMSALNEGTQFLIDLPRIAPVEHVSEPLAP